MSLDNAEFKSGVDQGCIGIKITFPGLEKVVTYFTTNG